MIAGGRRFGPGILTLVLLVSACGPQDEAPPGDTVEAAFARGDGYAAELALRAQLDAGAPREAVAADLGRAELLQGNLAEARYWLELEAFDAASEGRGQHMLGRLRMREGDLPAAGRAFDEALRHLPDDPELWVDIGRLRYRGGEQRQALEASEHALELDPGSARALEFRAQLERDARGPAAALPLYERAVARSEADADLLLDYAATLVDAGRASDALDAIRRATALNQATPRAFYLQAVIAARGEDWDLARRLLRRSGMVEREVPAALLLSGLIELESGNAATAVQTFERLAALRPDNALVRPLLARALAAGGAHRELTHRFADRARDLGAAPYLQMLVARSFEALGDRAEAAELLRMAAAERPASLRPLPAMREEDALAIVGGTPGAPAVRRMRELLARGDTASATALADQLLARFDGSGDVASLAGDAYFAAGRPERAVDLYRQAAAVRQSWPLVRRMVAAYDQLGDREAARGTLDRFVAGRPFHGEALTRLAEMEVEAGRSDRSERLARRAMRAGGDRPYLLRLRARIARSDGKAERARRLTERARQLDPFASSSTTLAQR